MNIQEELKKLPLCGMECTDYHGLCEDAVETFIEQALTNQKQEILDKVKKRAEGVKKNCICYKRHYYCGNCTSNDTLNTLIKELDNI
jgi:hypothetical protein